MLSEGVWQTLDELQDTELRRLAELLPATVMRSRADSTSRKYINAFKRWKVWAEAKEEIAVFPIEEATFALYLRHIGESTQSRPAVEEVVNAVSWLHLLSGLAPINEYSFVRASYDGRFEKNAS